MRRIHLFLVVLTVTLVAFLTLALVSWYLATTSPAYYGSSWMKQMWGGTSSTGNYGGMGGMMGDGSSTATSTSYLWVIPVALGAVAAVAVIGVAFYFAYPELKYIRGTCNPNMVKTESGTQSANAGIETGNAFSAGNNLRGGSSICDVLLKTLTPEEKKVMDVLVSHQGKYLQKYVVKETGLSRLRTHRIVARFAQRGIVTVKEFGNTNEIVVSDWVKDSR